MAQLNELRSNFKEIEKDFNKQKNQLFKQFEKSQQEQNGKVTFQALENETADFGLYYCLSESVKQVERCLQEKPSRELALVKTKLQEAIFWAEKH